MDVKGEVRSSAEFEYEELSLKSRFWLDTSIRLIAESIQLSKILAAHTRYCKDIYSPNFYRSLKVFSIMRAYFESINVFAIMYMCMQGISICL